MNEAEQQPLSVEPESGDYGQTRFAEESVILTQSESSPRPAAVQKKRSPVLVAVAILLPLSLVLMVVVLILGPSRNGGNGPLFATPVPSPVPTTQSELDRRFAELAGDIEAADPTKGALAFPPIDFSLDLQDATALRQRQRR